MNHLDGIDGLKQNELSFAERSRSDGDASVGSSCDRSFNTPVLFTRKPMETSDGKLVIPTKADKASVHSSPVSITELQDFGDAQQLLEGTLSLSAILQRKLSSPDKPKDSRNANAT